MQPKSGAAATKGLEAEEVLQAVILADSFDDRFKPLTSDTPRCLLPLCNVPLIEYTLEFLALSSVQKVFICCQSHPALVREYIRSSKWGKKNAPMEVQVVVSQECYSVGDALRELDTKQLLGGDFILVHGDLVANFPLTEALRAHQRRKTTDKNAIMTMILKSGSAMHSTRDLSSAAVYALDASTQECVYYEALDMVPHRKNSLALETEVFKKHPELELRNDLIDCQIDICSLEVLALFTENFDYQELRRDFVHGVLTSDLLDKTIYAEVLTHAYAARATSLVLYSSISKDLLRRWTHPVTPESMAHGDADSYRYVHGRWYQGQNVRIARTSQVGANVMLGPGCIIGEHVKLENAVLGRNCRIGDNTQISNAYLWDNVCVGSQCTITRSVLAKGVTLHDQVQVTGGAILGPGVSIGPNVDLPPGVKLYVPSTQDDSRVHEPAQLGAQGSGVHWTGEESDDADSDEEEIDPRQQAIVDMAAGFTFDANDGVSSDSSGDESDHISEIGEDEFNYEVAQTFERAVADGHSVEVAALELNTLRMSYNANYHTIRQLLIPVIMRHVDMSCMSASLKKMMTTWAPLLGRMIHSDKDQVDSLFLLQEYCAHSEMHERAFFPTVRFLYELDVVEEDAILAWYGSPRALSIDKSLRDTVTPFIQWLQEADEEESGDDEEDSD